MADDDDDRRVNLMSQEGDQFEVEVKVAKMSELVKTMIPEEADEDEEAQRSPPNVKSPSSRRSSSSAAATRGAHVRDRSPEVREHARGRPVSGTRTTWTSIGRYLS